MHILRARGATLLSFIAASRRGIASRWTCDGLSAKERCVLSLPQLARRPSCRRLGKRHRRCRDRDGLVGAMGSTTPSSHSGPAKCDREVAVGKKMLPSALRG
jgi:hypothetical protein